VLNKLLFEFYVRFNATQVHCHGRLAELDSGPAPNQRSRDTDVMSNFKIAAVRPAVFCVLALQMAIFGASQSGSNPRPADSRKNPEVFNVREARKAMRRGQYDRAAKIFNGLVRLNPNDFNSRLGASFAYLKIADYVRCFDEAAAVLKTQPGNARAHALAGLALLRAGYVKLASGELQVAANLDSKEALAYGGASEIDYSEGRLDESRRKSLYAHKLDPGEPDFLISYARASSRAEDFKEAADAYELFLQIAPITDADRRERILGLISFYRQLSGIHVHQVSGAESVDVPFDLGTDRRPYLRVKVNGRDALFVVDTGSGFTVISREAARRFGVSEMAKGGKSEGVGGSGKFQIVYGLIRTIDIGATTLRMVPCFIRPFHAGAGQPAAQRAEGFIGLSILSQYIAELDYKERKLRLDRGAGGSLPASGPGISHIPFRTTENGLISVETELDGKNTINSILDSGASSTVISAAAVNRLNLHDGIIKGETRSVVGAAGVTRDVEMLLIRNLRVADLQQTDLPALIMDLNAINETSGFEQSGIIGGDFLRNFRLKIDFNRGQLTLQRQTPTPVEQ
jgi:predicted aspartyl protease